MKTLRKKIVVMGFVLALVPFGFAFADDFSARSLFSNLNLFFQDGDTEVIECNVLDYGAEPDDDVSDSAVINQALGEAYKNPDKAIHVIVPKGVYHLASALRIYSNTTLSLENGAKIVADFGNGEMLNGLHYDQEKKKTCQGQTCTHGKYTQLENITIEGGSWEGLQGSKKQLISNMSIFILRHGHDITIRNTTVKYAATHNFNLSSTKNVLVENVTFKNSQEVTDPNSKFWTNKTGFGNMDAYNGVEAIHLDTCDGVGESGSGAYPLDCTPCQNITVTGCTFNNVWAGVGNHHPAKKQTKRSSDITVVNNTFNNIRYFPVYAIDFDRVIMKNNQISNAAGLTALSKCKSCTVKANSFSAATKKAGKFDPKVSAMKLPSMWITEATSFNIRNNTLSASRYRSLIVNGGKSVNIINNKFLNAAEKAVRITSTTRCNTKSNTIKSSKGFGIQADQCKKVVLENNIINQSKESGIRVSKSTATINNNKVTSAKTRGIQTSDSTVTISKNTVNKSKDVGIRVTGGKATIKTNKVFSSGPKAIHVDKNTKKLKILSNKIKKTKLHGIMIRDCNKAKISKNVVSNVKSRGLAVHDSLKVRVDSNDVSAKGDAVYIAGQSKKNYCSATITHNILNSSSLSDLRLSYCAYHCKLVANKLKHHKFSTSAYFSSYTLKKK